MGSTALQSCQFCLSKLDIFFIDNKKSIAYNTDEHPFSIPLKRNEVIFSEGKYPKGIFQVHKGLVKIFKIGKDGKEQIIQICKAGEIIGFRAVLSENPYNVNAAALEDNTEICFISSGDFNQYKNSNLQLQNRLIQELSTELQEWADFVTDMTQRTVRQRTALALIFLHEAYDEKEINVAREDLANMVGTATESLIRLINEFKKDSIITVSARKIQILDFPALKRIAED
mgnify:FL=1